MISRILTAFFFFLASFSFLASPATAENAYLQELILQAQTQKLSEAQEWKNLLHYKERALSGQIESLADDPKFFLSADGKHNPQEELQATLRAFFSEVTADASAEDLSAQCVFPARYAWLKQELYFDSTKLPELSCPRLTQWLSALDAKRLTLIYPAAYLNNPASMFGHTMLRIDASDQNDKTRLLAYGVTYAADAGDDDILFFAVRGLTGLYPGKFGILPYYAQVRLYSDIESRDIWEYPLQFTDAEIHMLLLHLWELAPTYFDYYFFDENCSYHLLSLFEVARPSLHVTDEYFFKTIPIDTLRDTIAQVGLSGPPKFRSSSATLLRERARELSGKEKDFATQLAAGDITAQAETFQELAPPEQARTLEVASELLQYKTYGEGSDEKSIQERTFSLLSARSKLPATLPPVVPEPKVRPDQGHRTGKIGLSFGASDGDLMTELDVRPAYHNLLDPSGGFVSGAQLDFLDTRLRYREDDHVSLERFSLIDILSVSPRDEFLKPTSWRIHLGMERERTSDTNDRPYFSIDGGAGITQELVPGFRAYVLPEVATQFAEHYDGRATLGIGSSAGLLLNLSDSYATHLFIRSQRFPFTDEHSAFHSTWEQRLSLGEQQDIRFSISRSGEYGSYFWEGMITYEMFL